MLRYVPLLMVIVCALSYGCSSHPPSTGDRTAPQPEQPGGGGTLKLCTEPPPSSYTSSSELESRVKADLPVIKTEAEVQTIVKDYLRQETGGTKEGENFNRYMFTICQMANNGKWSDAGTQKMIEMYWEVKRTDPKAEQMRQAAIASREGRAWLTVKFIGLCKDNGQTTGCLKPSIDDKRQFKVDFRNSGKTPSLKTSIRFCVRSQLPEDIDHEWIRRECLTTKETSVSVMGPDIHMATFAKDKRMPETQTVPLFPFGLIEYEDVYKIPHWTTFCFRSPNANTIDMTACSQSKGNDVDGN